MLEEDDYVFLERYLDATKANLFFARSVVIVEGPGEALLLPTLAKLLNYSFTDYGTSLVDVRSTGLRRYARIFQRKDISKELDIRVACITDRDVMPNCAPKICINKDYTENGDNWPSKDKRKWKAESDFSKEEATEYLKGIKQKADGQKVKTFVADHWTLEYELAYIGLQNEEMKDVLINSLMKVSYVKAYIEKETKEFNKKLNEYETIEERASYYYSFFASKKASKAEFAQQLEEFRIESQTGVLAVMQKTDVYLATHLIGATGIAVIATKIVKIN